MSQFIFETCTEFFWEHYENILNHDQAFAHSLMNMSSWFQVLYFEYNSSFTTFILGEQELTTGYNTLLTLIFDQHEEQCENILKSGQLFAHSLINHYQLFPSVIFEYNSSLQHCYLVSKDKQQCYSSHKAQKPTLLIMKNILRMSWQIHSLSSTLNDLSFHMD